MAERFVDTIARTIERRRMLGTIGKAAFAILAGTAVAAAPQAASASGCCTHCRYTTIRWVYCCELGFPTNCSGFSCFTSSHTWWAWACCHAGRLTECYECCDFQCSIAYKYGSCPCGEPQLNGFELADREPLTTERLASGIGPDRVQC